jgi:hypothetical protein
MPDKLPIVCAWCQRVQQEDGSYKEAEHPALVSHGICPDCKAEVEQSLKPSGDRATLSGSVTDEGGTDDGSS